MQGRLLLNVVVGKGAAVLELLASEDQALLVRRNALLVLNLGLDIVDGVRRLNLKGDGLAGEGLNDCGELVKEESKDSGSEWGAGRCGEFWGGTYRSACHHGGAGPSAG